MTDKKENLDLRTRLVAKEQQAKEAEEAYHKLKEEHAQMYSLLREFMDLSCPTSSCGLGSMCEFCSLDRRVRAFIMKDQEDV